MHLANHCSEASASLVRKYLTEMLEHEDNTNKKRKVVDNNKLTITDYHNSKKISNGRITRINHVLAKFFVTCGISFQIVEYPFFINFIKELNSAYELPTREFYQINYLSGS